MFLILLKLQLTRWIAILQQLLHRSIHKDAYPEQSEELG